MLRIVHLTDGRTVVLDVVAWSVIHVLTAYVAHRMPIRWLQRDWGPLHLTRWDRSTRVQRCSAIHRWKDRLPEAGALFTGGISKRRIPPSSAGGLERFVVETRRGELAHWWALAAAPLFALFNPPVALVFMALYASAVNLPCIAVQRYNRVRLERMLSRRAPHGSRSVPSALVRSSRGTTGSSIP